MLILVGRNCERCLQLACEKGLVCFSKSDFCYLKGVKNVRAILLSHRTEGKNKGAVVRKIT